MPLPLPNLDSRRWTDLVEEGKALIPSYAPAWTDHNVHDPGITLVEMLAWLVEQEIYRANRIPEAHIRKLLALAGFPVLPPQPASVALSFSAAGTTAVELPAGFTVAAAVASEGSHLRFRLNESLTVLPTIIRAVQTFDSAHYVNQTRTWHSSLPFPAWGDDPAINASGAADASPALYIGLDPAPPAGATLSLWLAFAGRHSLPWQRERIVEEARQQAEYCRPVQPLPCEPVASEESESNTASAALVHHGAACVWEYFDGGGWAALEVRDESRCLTLDGPVVVKIPDDLQALTLGIIESPLAYLRCRISEGRPDEAPVLRALQVNATLATQAYEARSVFEVQPGTVPPAGLEPVPGQAQRLQLTFDSLGRVTSLAVTQDEAWPEVTVFGYTPATSTAPGALACTLVFAGAATGLPGLTLRLPESPLADGNCRLWVIVASGPEEWQSVRDLEAAGPADRVFALDPATGVLRFGDGHRGRLPPRDAAILTRYAVTAASAGNVAAGSRWHILGADDEWNEALLGGGLGPIAPQLGSIANPLTAGFGVLDTATAAAGRAAERLWSHERLLELLAPGEVTLDQLPRERVLARAAPPRATTLLDYERLALDVPGTVVVRARAWSGVDARYPCLQAPGCVSIVIVPGLPKGRPEPTSGLLETVYRYLDRRRTIGTRLIVVGPEYVTVRVKARVRTQLRADATRTRTDVLAAIDRFLDPMAGGPDGRGWRFGRDVYRSEVLQVIDNVPGVDYVESLELFAGEDEAPCGNVCIGLRSLVTPGEHELEVL